MKIHAVIVKYEDDSLGCLTAAHDQIIKDWPNYLQERFDEVWDRSDFELIKTVAIEIDESELKKIMDDPEIKGKIILEKK